MKNISNSYFIKTTKYLIRLIEFHIIRIISLLFRIYPIDNKKVVVCSYYGM